MLSICEVGPRDGLQNEDRLLALAERAELVERLAAAGLRQIEVGSFVNSRLVPAMAETDGLLELLAVSPEVRLTALVLGERGYERLSRTSLSEVRFAFTATETFNQRNARRCVEDSLREIESVIGRAHRDGRSVSVTIGAAFGCPFEGAVDPGRVRDLAERIAAAGADELILADTIGVAVPSQVRNLIAATVDLAPSLGLHLHNTRNSGYANALAGLEAGIDLLDAGVGGAGGCPFAPRATGNIATEDLVYLLEREGVATGIDLDRLIETAEWLSAALGHPLDGHLHRAGTWFPAGQRGPGAPPDVRVIRGDEESTAWPGRYS